MNSREQTIGLLTEAIERAESVDTPEGGIALALRSPGGLRFYTLADCRAELHALTVLQDRALCAHLN